MADARAGIHGGEGEAIMNDMINDHDDYTQAEPETQAGPKTQAGPET
jgi:hypothetical protein